LRKNPTYFLFSFSHFFSPQTPIITFILPILPRTINQTPLKFKTKVGDIALVIGKGSQTFNVFFYQKHTRMSLKKKVRKLIIQGNIYEFVQLYPCSPRRP